uniref:F-box domain-containing protein n=1 Tax=Myotis lucifugus TaxID=59463 RepID=G1QG39_MYOLU
MEECACLCRVGSSRGCRCRQECQGPAERAAAEGKPAPAEKHMEAEAAWRCCAGSGGISSPMRPPHCSLQDLPPELLVEIFASLPGTDLPSLAQACTKFHHILHTDSIWRRRCREEFGVPDNLPDQERRGMSYREVYAKLFHPYRHILGLWQKSLPDQERRGMSYREVYAKLFHPYRHILGLWQLDHHYRILLKVVVDGLCITGSKCWPPLMTDMEGPLQFPPSFRIRLTERKSATVEYMDSFYSLSHSRHMQIQKDRFSIQWIKRDQQKDSPTRLRGERGRVLLEEDRLPYYCETYHRVYLPPSHPDDLIRPGLFQGAFYDVRLMIAVLSFHGKYARVTSVMGGFMWTLEIHLMRRIQPPDGEIFRNFNELSHVVQEIEEQVIREQQQQQQQQEDGTEESEGHGWQSPAQPSVVESGAAASEEQPVPFVLPVGVRTRDQNYPQTCRMCFYGVNIVTSDGLAYPSRCPGVFILFDENHFGFIWLELKYFFLFGRVQNTFQNVEAPSPQAFLEMLSNIQSGPP